jgi:hypothetical protein
VPKPRAVGLLLVCHAMKPVGEPDAGDRHVRFDERGWETERWPKAASYRAHPRLYPCASSSRTRLLRIDDFKATAFKLHCEALVLIAKRTEMRRIIVLVASTALLSAFSPAVRAQSPDQDAPSTDCDKYAADPFDSDRKTVGVPFEQINAAVARVICYFALQASTCSRLPGTQRGRNGIGETNSYCNVFDRQ